MKVAKAHVAQYLKSKQHAWAPTTLRSESYRLAAVAAVLDGNPATLWAHLETKGVRPYARVTTWVRVVSLYDFLIKEFSGTYGVTINEYRKWRTENGRLFKNAYTPRFPSLSFEDAKQRLSTLDKQRRGPAENLLFGALRSCELPTITAAGEVTGKGGKVRKIYVENPSTTQGVSYQQIYRALKKLGLKPHDLRKLALSKLVELGASPFELQKAAGWSSVATAESYIKLNEANLKTLFSKLVR